MAMHLPLLGRVMARRGLLRKRVRALLRPLNWFLASTRLEHLRKNFLD
ncbi:hypothetical protein [Nitrosomonas sp. Nm33]|nr:hypothetical protein [Nitrosomonas sp. Nm33]